jgi:hypothetical protein
LPTRISVPILTKWNNSRPRKYYENSSFFWTSAGCGETFSEHGFQVSGVRFQAGSRVFTTDT